MANPTVIRRTSKVAFTALYDSFGRRSQRNQRFFSVMGLESHSRFDAGGKRSRCVEPARLAFGLGVVNADRIGTARRNHPSRNDDARWRSP